MFKRKRIDDGNNVVVKTVIPDWLFTPIENNFENDPYFFDIQDDDPEFYHAVLIMMGLQSTYNNYNDWFDACALYDSTIPIIYDHYGGEENTKFLIKNLRDDELELRGWKRRPRLKGKAKRIRDSGIQPSRTLINPDQLDFCAILDAYPEEGVPEDQVIIKEKKPKGKLKRIFEAQRYEEAGKYAVGHMYTSKEHDFQDIISAYYSSQTQYKTDTLNDKIDPFEESLRNKIKSQIDNGWKPEENYSSDYYIMTESGSMYDRPSYNQFSLYKEIFEDTGLVTIERKKLNKEDTHLYDEVFGAPTMTKKKRKKQKEAIANYEKIRKKRENSQRELAKLLSRSSNSINLKDGVKVTFNDYRKG